MNNNLNNNNVTNFNTPKQPVNNTTQFQTFQQPIYNQRPIKNKRNNKKILLIVIVVAIIAAIIIKIFVGPKVSDKKINSMFDIDSFIRVEKDGKYGYIDSNGKFVIQPQYDYATEFYQDHAIVALKSENSANVYQVIDKSGNVKATAGYSSDIKYIEEANIWIINDQLYDDSLKKLSPDDVEVSYKDAGYLKWSNKTDNTAGIMNSSGKITYTYKFVNNENYFNFDPSDNAETLKENYCKVNIENKKYGIVNCDTGKIVYDYIDKYISNEDNNMFEIETKSNYEFVSIMYIQNDKIVFQSSSKNVSLYYSNYGYIEIIDKDKAYDERYSYIDISKGQITDKKPSSSSNTNDEWEEFTKITKFSCNSGYGLMSGEKIKIPCEWSNIKYFDLMLYKYLSSKGKEYVITQKDGKSYLINLKDGKAVAEFNASNIYLDDDSTFIYYRDAETSQDIIYNLITGKSLTIENNTNFTIYKNYITLREDGKLNYYNTDLKLIYTK